MRSSMFRSDRAVSESIGFILVTGIVLTSIAVIFAIGYPSYNSYVNEEHMQNMREGFYLVSDNCNKVAMFKTPFQSSELRLYGGTLNLKKDGYFSMVCYSDSPGTDANKVGEVNPPINVFEYTKDGASIAYVTGGVFEKTDNSVTVVRKPGAYFYTLDDGTSETFFVPVITFYNDGVSMGGNGLSRISLATLYYSRKDDTVGHPPIKIIPNVKLIRITLDGEYNKCLSRYFVDEFQFISTTGADGKIVLERTFNDPITVNTVTTELLLSINEGR